jgi:hypothetical protein
MHTDHIRTDPAYSEALRACGLDRVEAVLTRLHGRVAAWSRTTDTLYVPGPDGGPGFYLKRYYYRRWRNRVRGMFRGTFFGTHRGETEFRTLGQMRALGIPAVRPVAYGSRRVGHFVTACFLITEEVPQAANLTSFACDAATGVRTVGPAQRRAMARQLAHQVSEMHAVGFSHGQLFWRNVLVRTGPHGEPEFFFLDAHPAKPWQRFSRPLRWWQSELAHVAASATPFTSRTERLRFARHYFGVERLTPELKCQVREVVHDARRWRRHEAQRIKMSNLFDDWNRQLESERADATAAAPSPGGRP